MSIVRWNPAREIDEFFNQLDRGFSGWGENIAASDWNPAVDINETDNDYEIDLELPAVQPSDVKVTFKDGVLAVTGERKFEKESKGKVHRVERRYGRFSRSFRLPENADENGITASAKDGVLHLKVSKRAAVKPRAIEVKVS
ncbi:MAG TPA: Hsp20/alpha crystallin family protein [Pseudomonadales bacterium]|nr:Hsp20/alpha crystallin family protein [Pseudomonadales bacterium]